jgi:two-component system response regulator NreC
MKTRIVLLEDHVVVRRALVALLERRPELAVVGEAEVKRRFPKRRVLVLTMYADEFRAAEALAAGADGYAIKEEDETGLCRAVDVVLSGERYLSPQLDRAVIERLLERCRDRVIASGPLALLSRREREIFDLMIRGHSCQQIARLLFISPRTADTHRSHIFDKLRVHSTAELVRFAARFGLLGDDQRAAG